MEYEIENIFYDEFTDTMCPTNKCLDNGIKVEFIKVDQPIDKLDNGIYNFSVRYLEPYSIYLYKLIDGYGDTVFDCDKIAISIFDPTRANHACLAGSKRTDYGPDNEHPLKYPIITGGVLEVHNNNYNISNNSGHFKPDEKSLDYMEFLLNLYIKKIKINKQYIKFTGTTRMNVKDYLDYIEPTPSPRYKTRSKTKVGGKKSYNKRRKIKKVIIKKSSNPDKKYMAIFTYNDNKTKTTHFGSSTMSDYTIHKDKGRKLRYIKRHKKRENWNDPVSAGALSRWILWNKPSLRESIKDYKNKFNLK